MKNIINKTLKKLSSRKLWTAVAGIFTGLSIVFGADQSAAATVSGAVVSIVSVAAYIITEGKIDAAALCDAVSKIRQGSSAVDSVQDKGE